MLKMNLNPKSKNLPAKLFHSQRDPAGRIKMVQRENPLPTGRQAGQTNFKIQNRNLFGSFGFCICLAPSLIGIGTAIPVGLEFRI
jgi:hypothetical protein